ncbi:MAG: hypothetical protein H8D37_00250 [Chloroflexi bacterium]|nr:hypothetical protein [Chloroflexota bacterium]
MALKDLVRLRLEETHAQIADFEQKYGMSFRAFENAWKSGEIPDAHSWTVEQDYLAWEAAITDAAALEEVAAWLV